MSALLCAKPISLSPTSITGALQLAEHCRWHTPFAASAHHRWLARLQHPLQPSSAQRAILHSRCASRTAAHCCLPLPPSPECQQQVSACCIADAAQRVHCTTTILELRRRKQRGHIVHAMCSVVAHAKPRDKLPERTVTVVCAKCGQKLYKVCAETCTLARPGSVCVLKCAHDVNFVAKSSSGAFSWPSFRMAYL